MELITDWYVDRVKNVRGEYFDGYANYYNEPVLNLREAMLTRTKNSNSIPVDIYLLEQASIIERNICYFFKWGTAYVFASNPTRQDAIVFDYVIFEAN